jgi:hypothetical protein
MRGRAEEREQKGITWWPVFIGLVMRLMEHGTMKWSQSEKSIGYKERGLGGSEKKRKSRPPKLEKMSPATFFSFSLSKRHMGRTDVAHCVIFLDLVSFLF